MIVRLPKRLKVYWGLAWTKTDKGISGCDNEMVESLTNSTISLSHPLIPLSGPRHYPTAAGTVRCYRIYLEIATHTPNRTKECNIV
jgi:hypothetical protein